MGDGAVPIRRDNLTEAVSREIQRMIRSGEVAPGAWLPPQPELAARFGVGLSTLREGIKEFSSWPTIPQLYVKGEFVGGCDIVTEMFQSGELETLLKEKNIPHTAEG